MTATQILDDLESIIDDPGLTIEHKLDRVRSGVALIIEMRRLRRTKRAVMRSIREEHRRREGERREREPANLAWLLSQGQPQDPVSESD